jgi:hypothetical protein
MEGLGDKNEVVLYLEESFAVVMFYRPSFDFGDARDPNPSKRRAHTTFPR